MFQAKRFLRRCGMSPCQPQPASAKCATNSGHVDCHHANATLAGTEMEVRIQEKDSRHCSGAASRCSCGKLFYLSIRGGSRACDGRIWRRDGNLRLYGFRQSTPASVAERLLRLLGYALYMRHKVSGI